MKDIRLYMDARLLKSAQTPSVPDVRAVRSETMAGRSATCVVSVGGVGCVGAKEDAGDEHLTRLADIVMR